MRNSELYMFQKILNRRGGFYIRPMIVLNVGAKCRGRVTRPAP